MNARTDEKAHQKGKAHQNRRNLAKLQDGEITKIREILHGNHAIYSRGKK